MYPPVCPVRRVSAAPPGPITQRDNSPQPTPGTFASVVRAHLPRPAAGLRRLSVNRFWVYLGVASFFRGGFLPLRSTDAPPVLQPRRGVSFLSGRYATRLRFCSSHWLKSARVHRCLLPATIGCGNRPSRSIFHKVLRWQRNRSHTSLVVSLAVVLVMPGSIRTESDRTQPTIS